MNKDEPLLSVQHLSTCFRTDQGEVTAVDDVSFDVFPGETLGIVGESGCGKSVTSKSIMRLLPEANSYLTPRSRIMFGGLDLAKLSEREMRLVRGNRIAMIFQEPMTSLNPVFTVGWQMDEALKYHMKMNRRERRERILEMLDIVEIPNPKQRIDEYPHQLSGGMRQRVMIAMALSCDPELLIADEPTTALDVTIQSQILRLMENLKKRLNTAIILITHDLGVIAQSSDRVLVMYASRVVETGGVHDIFHRPQHPYTKALLESIPKASPQTHGQRLPTIEGIVPSLYDLPIGCRFYDRCTRREDHCMGTEPIMDQVDETRAVRCHYPVGEGS